MKYLSLVLLICSLFFVGCNSQKQGSLKVESEFPEELVGVWVAQHDNFKWGFKFENDGKISKFQHVFVDYVNNDGEAIYLEGPEPDTYATFIFGPIEATYNSSTKELAVKIILEHYLMKLPAGTLEGRSEDYFVGKISEDGQVWNAEWIGYGWLDGAAKPDPNAPPEQLVFKKLSDEELAKFKDVEVVVPHKH